MLVHVRLTNSDYVYLSASPRHEKQLNDSTEIFPADTPTILTTQSGRTEHFPQINKAIGPLSYRNFGLTRLGAVFTQPGRGISHEGFEAEWRDVILMSIEGDQFNRCEVFDETDLDAALARFDELNRQS